MDLEYSRRLEKIEAVVRAALPDHPSADWVKRTFPELPAMPPDDLTRSLTLPGWDLVARGGKRWRPLLMTLICESLGGGEKSLPLAPVVELAHNASLIHDDIEDSADERRGRPAIHILYGTDAAINAGSFLYFLAAAAIDAWPVPPETRNRVYRILGEHLRRLHLGQAMDIAWHRDHDSLPGLDDYFLMCRLKTGVLARLSAILGAIAADAAEPIVRKLGAIAEDLGVGFQIIDDVKNLTTGNPGKKRGDDIVEGKKSLPVLIYLHEQPGKRRFAADCFAAAKRGGPNDGAVEVLIRDLETSGALEKARGRGEAMLAATADALEGIAYPASPETDAARRLLAGLIGGLS